VRVLELFELHSNDGPRTDCYRTGVPVVNQDLTMVDGRRPRSTAANHGSPRRTRGGLPLGARPAHATAGTIIGALNMFRVAGHVMPNPVVPVLRHMQRGTVVFFDHSTQPARGHP
jgi:hypothetical protein